MFRIIFLFAAFFFVGNNAASINSRCPSGAWNGINVLLPVENCDEYIFCDNYGLGHLMSCSPSNPSLVFEPSLRMCIWPWLTSRQECWKAAHLPSPSYDHLRVLRNETDVCKEYTTDEPYPGCPQTSLPPGSSPVLLEIDGECGKFAQCDNEGIAHIRCCAQSDPLEPTLVFDKNFGKCVWKSQSSRKCDVNP